MVVLGLWLPGFVWLPSYGFDCYLWLCGVMCAVLVCF